MPGGVRGGACQHPPDRNPKTAAVDPKTAAVDPKVAAGDAGRATGRPAGHWERKTGMKLPVDGGHAKMLGQPRVGALGGAPHRVTSPPKPPRPHRDPPQPHRSHPKPCRCSPKPYRHLLQMFPTTSQPHKYNVSGRRRAKMCLGGAALKCAQAAPCLNVSGRRRAKMCLGGGALKCALTLTLTLTLHFQACSGHPTWPPGSLVPENYIYQHSLDSRNSQSRAEFSRITFTSTHCNPSPYRLYKKASSPNPKNPRNPYRHNPKYLPH